MSPRRVQLSRRKGWRLPPNTVSVAYPTKWANPHRPAQRTPEANQVAVPTELGGKDLACWCPLDYPCHADVLLRIANSQ